MLIHSFTYIHTYIHTDIYIHRAKMQQVPGVEKPEVPLKKFEEVVQKAVSKQLGYELELANPMKIITEFL